MAREKNPQPNGNDSGLNFEARLPEIFERVQHNNEESRTLAALRDTLLPGELRLPVANLVSFHP